MAAFQYLVRYELTVTCLSPLHTGCGDKKGGLLRGGDGKPMLLATSLLGVLRAYLSASPDSEALDWLLGKQSQESHVRVTNGIFQQGTEIGQRKRTSIEDQFGTAEENKLYSMDVILPGASFKSTLEVISAEPFRGDGLSARALALLEGALGALNSGVITLGGQKSNGLGRVTIGCRRRLYDMESTRDREDYLADIPLSEGDVYNGLPKLPQAGVTFMLQGKIDSLMIRSGRNDRAKAGGPTCNPCLREKTRLLVPGSSVKGSLRARIEAIAGLLSCQELLVPLLGREGQGEDDTGSCGHLRFEEYSTGQYDAANVTRVRIDRLTGGSQDKGLFTEEVCRVDSLCLRIVSELRGEEADKAHGLVFYALRDMACGLCGIGGGNAVGRGRLSDCTLSVLDGEKSCAYTFDNKGRIKTQEGDGALVREWLEALEKKEGSAS